MGMIEPFEKIYVSYLPLLKQLSHRYSYIAGFDEAFAVAASALYEAYLHFDADKGTFSAYAKTYVQGKLLHFLRREIRYRSFHVLPYPKEEGESWEEDIPDVQKPDPFELSDDLKKAIKHLSKREKLAILHYYVLDRSLDELALREGVSHSTVSTWRRRGIAKLKKMISM